MKIIILKIKNLIIPICIYLFIIFLLLFSKDNISAAKSGLYLWANAVLPSLLPFFIATELLNYTDITNLCGKLLSPIMRPLFNVPGEGAIALIMGIISGYPVGAKIVANLKSQHLCTDVEAERLIAFTNNSGPLFIVGAVGIGLFYNSKVGLILLITHILACITTGFAFRWWKKCQIEACNGDGDKCTFSKACIYPRPHCTLQFSNLGEALSKSILNAINSVLMVGGFIVLFSILLSILHSSRLLEVLSSCLQHIGIPYSISIGLFSGLIEVTSGLEFICSNNISIYIQLPLCSFILGFGGISVSLQVLSIISKTHISFKPYLIGKILQASLACIYTYLII